MAGHRLKNEFEEPVKEGQKRYENGVPPGYRDAKNKEGVDKYGDFLIWNEIFEKAKAVEKPIIVVTDDVKDDWWQEFHGAKVGPRPELVEEMLEYASQRFYLYTLSQFLDYASAFLKRKVDKIAIEEIKSDELQQRQAAKLIRQHRIPVAITRRLIATLDNKQRQLRGHRRQIDAQISAVGELQNEHQLQTLQQLLEERRLITQEIFRNSRRIRLYREEGNKFTMVTPDENARDAAALWRTLRNLAVSHQSNEANDDGDVYITDELEHVLPLPPSLDAQDDE